MAARRGHNPEVAGSNPAPAKNFMNTIKDLHKKLPFAVSAPLKVMKITQRFGDNLLPEYKTKFGMSGHNGLDLRASVGTDVFACFDGEIHLFTGDSGYGMNIYLQSDNFCLEGQQLRLQAIYGHLSRFLCEDGQKVKKGELMAKSGNTGFSSGPHLHWGMRPEYFIGDAIISDSANGYKGAVDPLSFLNLEKDPDTAPVMERYGQKRSWLNYGREVALAFSPITKRILRRLPTNNEINAVVYGAWSWPEVLDPTLFIFWQAFTRDEYEGRKTAFEHGYKKSIFD